MSAVVKRTKIWKEKVQPGKEYPIDDALKLVKELATAKFNESVDVAVNLGVDASKSDQQVRGSTVMPHGTGKTVRVAVFTQGKNADAARAAGDQHDVMLQREWRIAVYHAFERYRIADRRCTHGA